MELQLLCPGSTLHSTRLDTPLYHQAPPTVTLTTPPAQSQLSITPMNDELRDGKSWRWEDRHIMVAESSKPQHGNFINISDRLSPSPQILREPEILREPQTLRDHHNLRDQNNLRELETLREQQDLSTSTHLSSDNAPSMPPSSASLPTGDHASSLFCSIPQLHSNTNQAPPQLIPTPPQPSPAPGHPCSAPEDNYDLNFKPKPACLIVHTSKQSLETNCESVRRKPLNSPCENSTNRRNYNEGQGTGDRGLGRGDDGQGRDNEEGGRDNEDTGRGNHLDDLQTVNCQGHGLVEEMVGDSKHGIIKHGMIHDVTGRRCESGVRLHGDLYHGECDKNMEEGEVMERRLQETSSTSTGATWSSVPGLEASGQRQGQEQIDGEIRQEMRQEIEEIEESRLIVYQRSTPRTSARNLRHRCNRRPVEERLRLKRQTLQDMARPLKHWLYNHRNNPYPSKDEKLLLAASSTMSLTQVSNWFANARRRLKNTVREPDLSWNRRIKLYNSRVEGNAERLSISSEESQSDQENDQESGSGSGSVDGEEETSRERQGEQTWTAMDTEDSTVAPTGYSPYLLPSATTPSPSPTSPSLPPTSPSSPSTSPSPSSPSPTSPSLLTVETGGCTSYPQTILHRYLSDEQALHSQQSAIGDRPGSDRRSGDRRRNASGSLSSHDYEYWSSSSGSSPSHNVFDDPEGFEMVARQWQTLVPSSSELHFKEIGAALALTNLRRSSTKYPHSTPPY